MGFRQCGPSSASFLAHRTHVHIHVRTHMHAHARTHTRTYTHTYTHAHTHTHTRTRTHINAHMRILNLAVSDTAGVRTLPMADAHDTNQPAADAMSAAVAAQLAIERQGIARAQSSWMGADLRIFVFDTTAAEEVAVDPYAVLHALVFAMG